MIEIFKKELSKVSSAFSFLSILPSSYYSDLRGLSAYFPLVGWVLGGFLIALNEFLFFLPTAVRSFLIVLFWELFSRFLHLDALADVADAFLRGGEREDLLKIMSDSQVGAFGVSATTFLLMGKLALVFSISQKNLASGLLAAALFSRYLLTLLAFVFPAAKGEGLGWEISSTTGFKEFATATFFLLPGFFIFQTPILFAFSGLIFSFLMASFMVKKIAGLTGDILGATLELSELAILFFFLLFLTF